MNYESELTAELAKLETQRAKAEAEEHQRHLAEKARIRKEYGDKTAEIRKKLRKQAADFLKAREGETAK